MTVAPIKKLRIGLIANRSHQDAQHSALAQLLRGAAKAMAHLQVELVVVGRTLDAIATHGLMALCPQVERFPYGRDGGLMKLVARVVDHDPVKAVDAVIYLIDPVDPSSVFPEAAALKRQCVIHRKPFLSTLASALEWLEIEAVAAGAAPSCRSAPSWRARGRRPARCRRPARGSRGPGSAYESSCQSLEESGVSPAST